MTGTVLLLIAVIGVALYGFSEAAGQTAAVTTGTVFSDVNRNSELDAGEAGLADISVLCVPHFQHDSPIWITTDNSGQYRFETQAGCYLTQANVPDWATGDPDAHAYTAAHAGQTVTINFASWNADRCKPGYDLTGGQCTSNQPAPPPPPVCGPGQELVNGVCIDRTPAPPVCGPGQELVNGVCIDRTPVGPDISELANAIKTLTVAIEEIRQKLAAQDEKIAELSTLSDSLAAQSAQIDVLEQTIVTQDAEIVRLERMVDLLDPTIEDRGDFIPIYRNVTNPYYAGIKDWYIEQAYLENITERLNQTLALPHDVKIIMDECDGDINAYWYGLDNEIVLCYGYIAYFTLLLGDLYDDNMFLRERVSSTLTFTVLHELGHGLIDVYDLPIVGREEDAADQFAAIVALEYMDHNEGLSTIAATIERYNQRINDDNPPSYFAGRHSLNEQRLSNILCWTYGNDPSIYDDPEWKLFFDGYGFKEQRLNSCYWDYKEQSHNWYRMIMPFLMDPAIQPPGPDFTPPTVISAWIAGPTSYS